MSIASVINAPWAIQPEKFQAILGVYERYCSGEKLPDEEVEQFSVPARAQGSQEFDGSAFPFAIRNGVAMIPIEGVLGKKLNLIQRFSGGTSMQIIGAMFDMAMQAKEVQSILLVVDSPGGTVAGTQELASKIFAGRGKKPIISFVDGLMASAALWIGTAADRVIVSGETAQVGSIGVVATHVDISEREKMMGVKTTEIVSSEFKRAGSPFSPLSKESRDIIQNEVNAIHEIFIRDVGKFRGEDPEALNETAGNGLVFLGSEAIRLGLADSMASLEQTLTEMKSVGFNRRRIFMSNATEELGIVVNTVADLKKAFPEMCQKMEHKSYEEGYEKGRNESVKEAIDDAMAVGLDTGREEERERIKSIEAHAKGFPGHEALIEEMKFDGVTTPEQAAEKILSAEREMKTKHQQNLDADAPPKVPTQPSTDSMSEPKEATRDRLIDEHQAKTGCTFKEALSHVAKTRKDLFDVTK